MYSRLGRLVPCTQPPPPHFPSIPKENWLLIYAVLMYAMYLQAHINRFHRKMIVIKNEQNVFSLNYGLEHNTSNWNHDI
jgi:hypothetical protein